jgi:hypothetical protein
MTAFARALLEEALNLVYIAVIVAVGAGLSCAGREDWAIFAMPAAALCVVGLLARR